MNPPQNGTVPPLQMMKTTPSAVLLLALLGASCAAPSASRDLSGAWKVRLDPKDEGREGRWAAAPLAGDTTIRLPGTTALAGLGEKTMNADKGMLTAAYKFVGAAWYQREIDIPQAWAGRPVELALERVLWRSEVFVDGKQAGAPVDFLGAPHCHLLGVLAPGKHLLTVRVDNRLIHPIGTVGHHYYEGMQTLWNGVVGRIELKPCPTVSLVRFFPSYKNASVGVEITACAKIPATVVIRDKATGEIVAQATVPTSGRHELKLNRAPLPWDEFTPNLYVAEVKTGDETHRWDIGFRDLGKTEYHITINGRPLFCRNNHDGCLFPMTGHPPMDVTEWKRILGIYKDHGLNGIRFHSWTPPEAAFTAADELGMYIQAEHFWCTLDASPDVATFAKAEMRETLDRYGNHPSMCFVLYGNELGGDLEKMGREWLSADRAYDPRHLYSVAAGRRIAGADDFTEYGAKMNWQSPGTDWDYSGYFDRSHLPGIPETTHELGQAVVHPDWRELAKYTGILKPRNLEAFREAARAAGVEAQSAEFQKASGNLNRISYKADIEALLRTPKSAGYGLLDMHDYAGQKEALVGWLDAFYDAKGFLSAKEFSRYGSATVPLARLPKFVFTQGEVLTCKAEIAHYGASELKSAGMRWTLARDGGEVLASGDLPARDVPVGGVTRFGEFSCPLTSVPPRGEHLVLELSLAGHANRWDVWVFPKEADSPVPSGIRIATNANDAVSAMREGHKVLLVADKLGPKSGSVFATFKPVFWSGGYFGGQDTLVEGAVVQDRHPALALFPTQDVMDWQWQPLCSDARDYIQNPTAAWRSSPPGLYNDAHGFDLTGFPADYRPIVQPVADFHAPRKLGTVFEVRTQNGGKLLVTGYNILAPNPAARQLRRSLLAYMVTDQFAPAQPVEEAWILKTFENLAAPAPMPAGFENAILYVKAGGHHPNFSGDVAWTGSEDACLPVDAPAFKVRGASVWGGIQGTAWVGKKIRVEIATKAALGGVLKVRFADWDHKGRQGVVRSEDGQTQKLGAHEAGQWIAFPIRREDCLDGEIVLEAEATAGPDLMITDLAWVPQ